MIRRHTYGAHGDGRRHPQSVLADRGNVRGMLQGAGIGQTSRKVRGRVGGPKAHSSIRSASMGNLNGLSISIKQLGGGGGSIRVSSSKSCWSPADAGNQEQKGDPSDPFQVLESDVRAISSLLLRIPVRRVGEDVGRYCHH